MSPDAGPLYFEDLEVGLGEVETASTRIARSVRLRMPWLVINLGTAFVATVILLIFNGKALRSHGSGTKRPQ